jgi:hypothetical protein
LNLDFIDSFESLGDADIYIVSLKMASTIFQAFQNFMRNNSQSKFLFLEEYKQTLTDEDFEIRDEQNTDIYMYTPKKALKIVIESIHMKYTRMFCWLRPHEKDELMAAADNRFPIVFAKSYDDFIKNICDGDYLVVSFEKVNNELLSLIRKFHNNTFAFYEIQEFYEMTELQFDIANEQNVIKGQYGAEELVKNYLGLIPDLWNMRLSQIKTSGLCV